MPSLSALASARRNLAWRIDRFLKDTICPKGRVATPWQLNQVVAAIDLLEEKRFADGERLMLSVEKASVFEPADYVPVAKADVRRLCERLERVVAA